jgi:carboxyl-terminal processing protease
VERVVKAGIAVIVVFAIALAGFIGGAVFERMQSPSISLITGLTSGSDLPTLVEDVSRIMKADALEPSSDESMTVGAISGMLSSLGDPYASYFDPKDYKEFKLDATGEFFGVGMTLGSQDGTPVVVNVIKDTPAEKAGLKAGDVIYSIDGVHKKNWDIDDVVGRVRGPKGTKVTLVVRRDNADPMLTFTLTRDKITIPNVMSEMIGKDVGHIRLMQFNERAADEVRSTMAELDGKGAKGFILDLRGNPGGLLRSSVEVASLFVESGVIVRVDERGKPETEEMALGSVATDKPLVLLIDGNSASASEIVAGALQDYKRATLVGEKSYGKGSVQTVRDLRNGGAIKLTTAHYLTPKKRVINKKGVTPDVVVKMEPKLQAAAATDTQLKKAAEVLRGKF